MAKYMPLNMSQAQARASIDEIFEGPKARKLDALIERFAKGELNREEFGLRIEMLLESAYDDHEETLAGGVGESA